MSSKISAIFGAVIMLELHYEYINELSVLRGYLSSICKIVINMILMVYYLIDVVLCLARRGL